jgi:hypothetical protein
MAQDTPPDTTSLDIPSAIQAILGMEYSAPAQGPMTGISGAMGNGQTAQFDPNAFRAMSQTQTAIPSYAVGGQIGPGGMPTNPMPGQVQVPGMPMMPMASNQPGIAPPEMGGQAITPQSVDMEIQKFMQQRPQQVQQIQQAIQEELQAGTVSMEQLNMLVQMARAALERPDLYPKFRQVAIQAGLGNEQEVSQQYDKGILITLVIVGKALEHGQMGGQMPMAPAQMPSMRNGGPVPRVPEDQPVVIKAHEGEYVIPKHVVKAKGTEFFDRMLAQYEEGAK